MNDEKQILAAIDRIDCQLSPENLHCDGEISHAQAQRKANKLWRERGELEKKLGRTVPHFY